MILLRPSFTGYCEGLTGADEIKLFLEPKNHKKQKDVRGMFKKTWRCRSKTIKNNKKRPKMIKIEADAIDLEEKGVFLVFFTPKGHSECSNGYIGVPLGGYRYPKGTDGDPLGSIGEYIGFWFLSRLFPLGA
jgi:hypothetical protein